MGRFAVNNLQKLSVLEITIGHKKSTKTSVLRYFATNLRSIISHRIDYNEGGALKGQWHITEK